MKNKTGKKLITSTLALLMILATLIPLSTVLAAGTPPTTISAPKNFAVTNSGGSVAVCTLSAPDDLRALIAQTAEQRGYSMKILAQVDFKTDGGSWHYSSDWDNAATYTKYTLNTYNTLTGGKEGRFLGHDTLGFKTMFPTATDVPVPAAFNSWNWFKSHTMTFRERFAIYFYNNKDIKSLVFSDWSNEYVLSDSNKMDYKKIMDENAPTLVSSKIEILGVKKVPWVVLNLAQHPDAVQKFNAASKNSMWTEVWLRKAGDKEFKNVGSAVFSHENIYLDVGAYFGNDVTSYDAQGYEVKVRYRIDERAYQQSGVTAMNNLYSQFSNILAYNMPAWSGASNWATGNLQKASDMGLIPDILKGQDMTKSITREEFTEVALLMYQKASGITNTTPVSPNPFIDTTNPQILKAFKLGIVKGYSKTEFKPEFLINREQVAVILTQTIQLIAPDADYSTTGAPVFTDQKDISGWALDDCLYMAKIGIIKGTGGKFMPRAISDAQKALGYANASREQALVMSVLTVEKIDDIK